jgi:hypothetical protein
VGVHGGWGHWEASWWWSLILFAATVAIHAGGVVLIARLLVRWRRRHPRAVDGFFDTVPESIGIIVVVALLLSVLHAVESTMWALVYVYLGAFPSVADAMLYSVDSMTTRGSTGLDMEKQWRMMGATEAGNGMLLFGISTAFLFAVMAGLWKKPIGG